MSEPLRVLVAGCGDVGSQAATLLADRGAQVWGLRRQSSLLPTGVRPCSADLGDPATLRALPAVDYLLFTAAAEHSSEAGYRALYVEGLHNLLAALPAAPRRLLFTSSTGVYGQSQGEWVDEESPTEPQRFSGRIMLEAERLALASGLPTTLVRLGGIYGPGRNHLIERVRSGQGSPLTPILHGNRIHSTDAARLLDFLVERDRQGLPVEQCYLGVDDEPAPLHEVEAFIAGLLGVTLQRRGESQRLGGSKRCSNQRLRRSGFELRYPNYRDGYRALLSQ